MRRVHGYILSSSRSVLEQAGEQSGTHDSVLPSTDP